MEEGMSRMREMPALTIAPGESFTMSPGAYHLMLIGPIDPVEEGVAVTVELTLASGHSLAYQVPVERR